MKIGSKVFAISTILLFMYRYEILTIADALKEECFEDGTAVCNQGDMGDKFYLIKDGTAVCTQKGSDGESRKVLELSSGSYFGEVSAQCCSLFRQFQFSTRQLLGFRGHILDCLTYLSI